MKAHFFDLDTLISADNKVWIVSKTNPNIPILKINKSDFNLIRKGIYKNQNNKIVFSGDVFWLPEDLMNKIKIRCKSTKTDISTLSFSMQEFMNSDLVENIEYKINIENLVHVKNKTDDIYIICSKNTKRNYEYFISKLEEKMKEIGLQVKKYYFISETFYNRDEIEISHRKIRLLLQHIIGLKTDFDKFTDQQLEEYDEIEFYEDEISTIEMLKDCLKTLDFILSKSEPEIKDKIKEKLKSNNKNIVANLVTPNRINKFIKTKIEVKFPNLIRTFESFKSRF